MLSKSGNWDDFTDYVITSSTFMKTPESLDKKLSSHQVDHDRKPFDVYHNGKVFRSGVIPLYDAAGVEVGDIFAFADYTPVTSSRNLIIFFVTFCFILAAIFWVFLSSYFRKLEEELQNSMEKLDSFLTTNQDKSQEQPNHKEEPGSSEPQGQGPSE